MRTAALFPHLVSLHIDDVTMDGGHVSLTATAQRSTAQAAASDLGPEKSDLLAEPFAFVDQSGVYFAP